MNWPTKSLKVVRTYARMKKTNLNKNAFVDTLYSILCKKEKSAWISMRQLSILWATVREELDVSRETEARRKGLWS
jgi:hypothetical protein